MTRKFPELADLTKTSGFHSIVQHQNQLIEELSEYYDLYASIAEFDLVCREVMNLSKQFVTLDFQDNNSELSDLFLDVFVLYFKLNVYSVEVLSADKKSILSTYAKLYSMQYHESEPRYDKIVKFVQQDKNIIQSMQESLSPFSGRIANMCYQLKEQVKQSFNLSGDAFRNLASLSLTPKFSGFKAPPKEENEKVCLLNFIFI
jgi:hypothetical protein